LINRLEKKDSVVSMFPVSRWVNFSTIARGPPKKFQGRNQDKLSANLRII